MLSGTEANIVKSISRLGQATKGQISREVGFSSGYVDLLCRYLVRKGYLICAKGCYSLAKDATEKLPPVVTPHIDRKLKYLEYFEKAYQRFKKQISESLKIRR